MLSVLAAISKQGIWIKQYENHKMIHPETLERWMKIAQDTKKEFVHSKSEGVWYWYNRGDNYYTDRSEPFSTYFEALSDAINPYLEEDDPILFRWEKDGFMKGEYSIYERKMKNGEVTFEKYLFGVKREMDARAMTTYLNNTMKGLGRG